MSEHIDHRTLRLERLETRALLAANGFGEFTGSESDGGDRQGDRPGEYGRQEQSASRDGDSDHGREREVLQSRLFAKHIASKHQRRGRGNGEFGIRTQWHFTRNTQPTAGWNPTQVQTTPTLTTTSAAEGEQNVAPTLVARTVTPITNAVTSDQDATRVVIRTPIATQTTSDSLPESISQDVTTPIAERSVDREPGTSPILARTSSIFVTSSDTSVETRVDEVPVTSVDNELDSRPSDHADFPASAPESDGWIQDIGFPESLNELDPRQTNSQSSSPLSLGKTARILTESLPVVRDAALEALLVGPDVLIDLSESVVEFSQPTGSGGLIDFGLRATMGVHRSLDLITEDPPFDETDLRDLVLKALSEELDESHPLFVEGLLRLPKVDYAGAALLTAGMVGATHRRRKTDAKLLRTRAR